SDRNTYPQPENRPQEARNASAALVWTMFPKLSTDSTAATSSVTDRFMFYFNPANITLLISATYRRSAEPESRKATVSSLSPFRVVGSRYPPNSQPPLACRDTSTNRVHISRSSAGPRALHCRLERLVRAGIQRAEAHVPIGHLPVRRDDVDRPPGPGIPLAAVEAGHPLVRVAQQPEGKAEALGKSLMGLQRVGADSHHHH